MSMKGCATVMALIIMSTVVSASMLAYYATSLMVELSYKRLEHMQKRCIGEALLTRGALKGLNEFDRLTKQDSTGNYSTTSIRSSHEANLTQDALSRIQELQLWMRFNADDEGLVCQAIGIDNGHEQLLASCRIVKDVSHTPFLKEWYIP